MPVERPYCLLAESSEHKPKLLLGSQKEGLG